MQCKHEYDEVLFPLGRRGRKKQCHREAVSDRGLCLLHESWELKSEEETSEMFYKEVGEGIGDFTECILYGIDLNNKTIPHDLEFDGAAIKGNVSFDGATINGSASFKEATIEGNILFNGVKVTGSILFNRATIRGRVLFQNAIVECATCNDVIEDPSFEEATIKEDVFFAGATIKSDVNFSGASIGGNASLFEATVEGSAWFKDVIITDYAIFEGATIKGTTSFERATIGKFAWFDRIDTYNLTFEGATFHWMDGQHKACRAAKITQERIGNRELADYHFYREMEAMRKQKNLFTKLLELPIQYIFGYGVKPFWVVGWWLLVVVAMAFIYWLGHGVQDANTFWEHLYFSVVTSATPGYGGYSPEVGGFQILATFQAIFGTFMWAAFIVTFARKFMR